MTETVNAMSGSQIKYFVTGGAGFIGSHLVDQLTDQGEVTVYDNLSSGRSESIQHHLGKGNFRFIKADLLDLDTLKEAVSGQDIVFHLAANPDVRAGIENTELDLNQGVRATYNILEAMRLNKVRKFVFASSGTVYGEAERPATEESGPLLPISLYGASKLACEGLASAFCHLFNMQAWIFRLANIVGTRSNHGVVFDLINKLRQNPKELEILGDGTQQKPYLHINDCVGGMLFGLKSCHERVNLLNLGCESATDVTTIATIIVEAMGLSSVSFNYTGGDRGWRGDVPQVRFDMYKMRQLGWKPAYTSDEAVRKAVADILPNSAGKPGNGQ